MASPEDGTVITGAQTKVLIVGTGWAGYTLAHSLDPFKYKITVVSPQSTSPYTPLLASAACGLFDFRLAEEPIRRKSRNIRFIKASVLSVDFETKHVLCSPAFSQLSKETFQVRYDKLVLCPGCATNTFNIPGVDEHAYFVKNVNDAMAVRGRLSDMLEIASLPSINDQRRREILHVAIVGGGPTGIEMAAELTDLFEHDLGRLYPHLKGKTSVAVHDVAPQILSPFDKRLSEYATTSLKTNKVDIKVSSHILNVTADYIETKEDGKIPYGILIWATGNKSIDLVDALQVLKSSHGLRRILTDGFLRVRDTNGLVLPEIYALGDAADIEGDTLPTTAEVATQKARYLSHCLNSDDELSHPFKYKQRALVTYTGGGDGVIGGTHEYTGYAAWLAWRSGNLFWTRSWRRRFMICMAWVMDWVDGRDIARN